jgi:hypothetical protein
VRNRRFGQSRAAIAAGVFESVLFHRRLPLDFLQTYADLFALLRPIEGLASQSLLPLDAPDEVPEIDAERILFRGISQGSSNALGFLPLAPEVSAAVAFVGGGRSFEQTLHQVKGTSCVRCRPSCPARGPWT